MVLVIVHYIVFSHFLIIISNPTITVAAVFANFPLAFQFNRQITGIILAEWIQLLELFSSPDIIIWRWNSSIFFVLTLFIYGYLRGDPTHTYNTLWKSKIPLKIKIFVWLLRQDKILTKCSFQSRGWQGNIDCVFCGSSETVDHLFVTCSFISSLWSWIGNHNKFVFNSSQVLDLWHFNYWIPLKSSLLVELIRAGTL